VTLTVNDRESMATGTINFRLLRVEQSEIVTLEPGAVVEEQISQIGEQDVYRLDVAAGQTFTIEMLGNCNLTGGNRMRLDVKGAGVNDLIFVDDVREGDCLDVETYTADERGAVFITVEDDRAMITGDYSFTLIAG